MLTSILCLAALHAPLRPAPRVRGRAVLMEDPGGALAAPGTQLEQVLGSLPADEKYNAVLLSLLSGGSNAASALELVEEMSSKRLALSSDALLALINAAVDEGTPDAIMGTLRSAKTNGACRAFATPQLRLPGRPNARELDKLAPLPADERSTEVAAATAFSAAAALLIVAELLDLLDFLLPGIDIAAPPPPLVLILLAAGWGFDRYAQSGETAALIGRGLTRLFTRDLQRECTIESGSFLLGYLLGLPCCPFAPTVLKPLDMLGKARARPFLTHNPRPRLSICSHARVASLFLRQSGEVIAADVGTPARLVDRVLIWLLAPAAIESIVYRETSQSEPAIAGQFLEAARRREASLGVDVQDGGWSVAEDEGRVRWAYSEARRLLQRYSGVREALQERMATGVSAGECAVLIEERLRNQWSVV